MGVITYNKCLLLDERDFEELKASPMATFAELSEFIEDEALDYMGVDDEFDVQTELISVVSERFDAATEEPYFDPSYVCDNWKTSLENIAIYLGEVEKTVATEFLRTGDLEELKAAQLDVLQTKIGAEQFENARAILTGLENLNNSGLPGFRSNWHQELGGSDEAYDFREHNHGAGTRILVEYGVCWP